MNSHNPNVIYDDEKEEDMLSMIEDFYEIYGYEFYAECYKNLGYYGMISKFEKMSKYIVNDCKTKIEKLACLQIRKEFVQMLWSRNITHRIYNDDYTYDDFNIFS